MDGQRPPRDALGSSVSMCPGCGAPVDLLRAGHVAILDGAFRYFCSVECKKAYVLATEKVAALSDHTAAPPSVAPLALAARDSAATDPQREPEAEPSDALPAAPPHIDGTSAHLRFPEPEGESAREALTPGVAEAPAEEAAHDDEEVGDARSTDSSERLPSVALEMSDRDHELERAAPSRDVSGPDVSASGPGSRARRRPERAAPRDPVAAVGVAAGALSVLAPLAGDHGTLLQWGLAIVALASAIRVVASRARTPLTLAAGVSLALGLVAALASSRLHRATAPAHVAFVGCASAGIVFVDLVTARLRRFVERARQDVAEALAVAARVVRGEDEHVTAAEDLKAGETFLVGENAVIPADGTISSGSADVVPFLRAPSSVAKSEGDSVVAGASIVRGSLRVTATFAGAERAWHRAAAGLAADPDGVPLAATVQSLQWRAALLGAAVSFAVVVTVRGHWTDALGVAAAAVYFFSVTGVLALLGLAMARGRVSALRRGILYRDGTAFEVASRADYGVFCARGTVLQGEPELVAVELASRREGSTTTPLSEDELVRLAASVEVGGMHPFALAVLRAARARGIAVAPARSILHYPGMGVTALGPAGELIAVGSRGLLLRERVSVAASEARIAHLEAEGKSVLVVAFADRVVGLLALQDGLRPGARAAVQRMHDAGIEPVLLSGEARETCETIAASLDIEHLRPEVLPADRGAEVRALAEGGHVVAVVGAPAHDDAALGAATLAVAMSAAGAAPGEWGVALATGDIRDAAHALSIPRLARERARLAALVATLPGALALAAAPFGLLPTYAVALAVAFGTSIALVWLHDALRADLR